MESCIFFGVDAVDVVLLHKLVRLLHPKTHICGAERKAKMPRLHIVVRKVFHTLHLYVVLRNCRRHRHYYRQYNGYKVFHFCKSVKLLLATPYDVVIIIQKFQE